MRGSSGSVLITTKKNGSSSGCLPEFDGGATCQGASWGFPKSSKIKFDNKYDLCITIDIDRKCEYE